MLNKITISKKDLKYLLFYFILMEPRFFYFISGINRIFKILILASFIYLLVEYYCSKRKSKTTILIIAYHLYLILITAIKHGEIETAFFDSGMFCGLSILTDIALKKRPEFFYTKLPILLVLEVFINWLSMMLFPDGLYSTSYFHTNYFLGYDNQMINIFIPAVLFSYLAVLHDKKTYMPRFLLVTVCVCWSVIHIWSGASLVLTAIIVVGIVTKIIDKTRIFNMLNYLLANVTMFILVVILRLQQYYEYFVTIILGKSLTFTGRVYIWDNVINYILKNPIWGYGIESSEYRSAKMNIARTATRIFSGLHAHDRFLETAYRGGLILTIIYIAILLIATYYLMKNKEKPCAKVVALVIFAYLTGMLAEFYRLSYMFFPLMVIAENIDLLDNSLFLRKKKKAGTYAITS